MGSASATRNEKPASYPKSTNPPGIMARGGDALKNRHFKVAVLTLQKSL
jgi:hypothetical protein